jgi:hypothetical protein
VLDEIAGELDELDEIAGELNGLAAAIVDEPGAAADELDEPFDSTVDEPIVLVDMATDELDESFDPTVDELTALVDMMADELDADILYRLTLMYSMSAVQIRHSSFNDTNELRSKPRHTWAELQGGQDSPEQANMSQTRCPEYI